MRTCFVCMPLIEELKEVYIEIEESLGSQWECTKADDQRLPGMVTEKVVKLLLNADLIIAVAADPRLQNSMNPNVMYELGIAHSFRKPALVVSDETTGLPFDLRAVETILLDFSLLEDPEKRPLFFAELKSSLEASLNAPEFLDLLEAGRIPSNPVTTQLSETKIFRSDFPWLLGYCEVLKREYEAQTVWEITRDLYWPTEPLFLATIKAGIRAGKKHYVMVPEDDGITARINAIRDELHRLRDLGRERVDNLLRFVAVEKHYFVLWPISIVLYDADTASAKGGIICEPMESEVGHDDIDDVYRRLFVKCEKAGGLERFQEEVAELDWIERQREKTFDIALDKRVVDSLATAFAKIWNEKIWDQMKASSEEEQSALLKTWLIRR